MATSAASQCALARARRPSGHRRRRRGARTPASEAPRVSDSEAELFGWQSEEFGKTASEFYSIAFA